MLLVVGALEIPPIVNPGEGFDGVVALDFGNSSTATTLNSDCTGSLLTTGRHIITAAHCVDADNNGTVDPNLTLQVVFEMPTQHYVIDVDSALTEIVAAPAWDGNAGNGADLALIELPAIAPFPAERYDIFRGSTELNDLYVFAGYGLTGTGAAGQIPGSGDIKRLGHNEFGNIDTSPANGDILEGDFDDGSAGNNTLGDSLGLDNGEAATAAGDSGAAAFISGRLIAGLNSFSTMGNTFGDVDSWTRVSFFSNFIDTELAESAAIVLDMNLQPAGNDGTPDNIILRRDPTNAARVQLLLGEQEIWSDLATRVTSITVLGSGDDDTLTVDYTSGDPVIGSLTYDGRSPATSDTIVVSGTAASDTIDADLISAHSASVAVNAGAPIAVSNTELLLVNGLQGDDDLTITGPAGDGTNFIHTPGAGYDEGRVDAHLDAFPAVTLLPVQYRALGDGSVTVDGTQAGLNSLTVLGTNQPDSITVEDLAGNVVQVRHFLETQSRIDLFGRNFFTVDVLTLDGDDRVNWELGSNEDQLSFLTVDGGNAGVNGDMLNIHGSSGIDDEIFLNPSPIADYGYGITRDGNGRLIFGGPAFQGLELIQVEGDGGFDNDQLFVSGTGNNDSMRLLGGFSTDRIEGDYLTPVVAVGNFGSPAFGTITVSMAGGANDALTVHVSELSAAENYVIQGASADFDEIIVQGTSDDDEVDVTLNGTTVEVTVDRDPGTAGNENTIVFEADEISRLTFDTFGGNDLVTVDNSAGLIAIPMHYDGGDPIGRLQGVGDILNVITGGAAFNFQPGPQTDEGTVTVAGSEPVSFDHIELLQIDGTPFILPDEFEPNDSIADATVLGSLPKITLRGLTLHDEGGSINPDFFKITAQDTGKLIINAFFADDSELGLADVDLRVTDATGNFIADSASTTDNEQIIIPVVTQEMYFLEVFSFDGLPNVYDLEIENFPAPVPTAVVLDPLDDSGMSNSDNVTNVTAPTFFLQADLTDFEQMGIPIDPAPGSPGADVQVTITGSTSGTIVTGNASRVGLTSLWTFTTPGPLGDDLYFVNAAVTITDGQTPPASGRSQFSQPLLVTIDTAAPAVGAPDLLASSDTGMFDTDDVTNKMQPAFSGTAEANAKIRILANGVVVGQGAATAAGEWEVTVEPLDDGAYTVAAQAEDLAGNVSQAGQLTVWIDATEPNTPFLDLVTDTGHSDKDNITNDNTPTVTVTADDTVDGDGNPFPNDIKYRIYDRPGTAGTNGEVLLVDSFADLGSFSEDGFFVEILPLLADGVHNLKLEVEDRAGNLSHDFLLEIVIDTSIPEAFPPDLIDSSDTGMDDQDNVTNKMEPAFNGVGEAQAIVRVFATNVETGVTQLVGEGDVGSDLSDVSIGGVGGIGGEPDDGLGLWEVTVEPLADAVYEITIEIEDWAGNVSPLSEPLTIEVDTLAPNTPLLDLVAASDTGRHDDDNVTNDDTPTFTMTSTDPNQALHLFAENYKFRVFDRDEATPLEVLIYDSFAEFGDFTDFELLTRTVATLDEGVHNLKLEVEDRAGNISHDFLLQITVDVTPPPVTITGIDPAQSDTGIAGQPDTLADRITSITMTGFVGTAEADAIVRMWADGEEISGGTIDASDVFQGLTVAVPLDGNEAFPNGMWTLVGQFDLNDPSVGFPLDGVRQIAVTAEDLAGNVNEVGDEAQEQQVLDIFLDTQGPRVAAVNDPEGESVFDPKPTDGPSPLMHFLDILFTDEPIRVGESIIVGDDAVFVVDVSGSTSSSFGGTPVGDRNGDGNSDTILDAEIAALIALNQQLISLGLGDVSNVSVVPFGSSASALDMDPVADGVQLSTTPNADADTNGTPDVEDVLRSLNSGGGTNFEAALQEAITTITGVGTAPGNGNVVFLSDGFGSGDFADEVTTLQGMGMNLRAFGVGPGSSLTQLLTMDPMAMQFNNTDELLGIFGGGNGGGGGGSTGFVYPAVNEILATTPGNYQLVGDHTGHVLITQITFLDMTVSGDIGRTTVRLHFAEPLADDRYTLTVFDRIQDRAGNALDGDVQASSPGVDAQLLPSGDGVPGETFQARFTVDSRPEIGTYAHFNVYLDINGNFTFDPTNSDAVNRDLVFKFPLTQAGVTAEAIFAGNFAPVGAASASGFDKLGAYGQIDGLFRWLLDFDHDGVIDHNVVSGSQINGLPVAGDFNAVHPGDEIGLFDGTTWYLDTNGNNNIDAGDTVISGNLRGFPIVGDFDGDGLDDLGTWQDDRFRFDLAWNGLSGNTEHTIDFGFPGVMERPVATDMNQDGIDDIGLYVPYRDGVLPRDGAEWYFLISRRPLVDEGAAGVGTVDALDHPFEPVPFGTDLFAQFGDDLAIPIVGNFDPPVTTAGPAFTDTTAVVFRDGMWYFDTDGAGGAAEEAYAFGIGGDVPLLADFNRDGVDESAVFRNGTWYFDLDGNGGMAEAAFAFGIPGDVPVTGDFNRDGVVDAAVFRDGIWFIDTDGAGGMAEMAFAFGAPGDVPVSGDFNGDGWTDAGVFRHGIWFFDLDGQGQAAEHALAFGIAGDVPVPGDLNDDGKTELGVRRDNLWFFDLNGDGGVAERVITYGLSSDVPLIAQNGFAIMPPVNQPPSPPMMAALSSLSSGHEAAQADSGLTELAVDQAIEDLTAPPSPPIPLDSPAGTQQPPEQSAPAPGDDEFDQPLIELLDELGGL